MSAGLIERYLEYVRVERRLAARTVELYAIHLKTLAEKAEAAGVALDKVQTAHVRRWMAQLHSAGRESRGIALVLSCWRSFYRWLGNEGRVVANPVVAESRMTLTSLAAVLTKISMTEAPRQEPGEASCCPGAVVATQH